MDCDRPTTSKKTAPDSFSDDVAAKKRKYKYWKDSAGAMVPLKTFQRWDKRMEGQEENDAREEAIEQALLAEGTAGQENVFSENESSSDSQQSSSEGESSYAMEYASSDYILDSDDSSMDENDSLWMEEGERQTMLYENSKLSVEEAVLSVLNMLIRHKLPKTALKSQLNLINSMLPVGHNMPTTLYSFFKYIEDQAPGCRTIKHFFCTNCVMYISKEDGPCSICGKEDFSFFYEIDIVQQITRLLEEDNLGSKIQNVNFSEGVISDIYDGSEYRRINLHRNPHDITLIMYTDGISLVKSSKTHCWPLMFIIAELPPEVRYKNILIAGIWYHRTVKPAMNLFLRPFCAQLCENETIMWKHPETNQPKYSKLSVPLFIADAPARAQIQNILSYNGEYGCNLCEIRTTSLPNKSGKNLVRIYPYQNDALLRTHERMQSQAQIAERRNETNFRGVKGKTIISCLPDIDISTCVVPEFMHSVLLGITKQFLNVWLNKKGEWQIKKKMAEIDRAIDAIRPINTFARMPRSIKSFYLFKATELLYWLLYYSVPILTNVLPEKYLQHWMLLVISVNNLLQKNIQIATNLNEAENLLDIFVQQLPQLYGAREMSYNVHQLTHLVLIVRRWGPLWATSAFVFEDQNGVIAKSVHGTNNLEQEIINNIKIAQGAKELNNRAEKPDVDNFNQFLGKNIRFNMNLEQQNVVKSKIDLKNSFFYSRAIIRKKRFTSTSYKTTKTNNFTVVIQCKTKKDERYAVINCFIANNLGKYLLIQDLVIANSKKIIHNETKAVLKHIIPFKYTNKYEIVNIEDILHINLVMQVNSYICKVSNPYKTIF